MKSYLSSTYFRSKTHSRNKAVHASFSVAWKNARVKKALSSGRKLGQTNSRENSQDNVQWYRIYSYWSFVKQHHQGAHPRTLSRCSETNCFCFEAKWKSYFRVGWDYRFRKRCTVHVIRAIPCDWGLRGTISLLPSTWQTYHKKGNVKKINPFKKHQLLRTHCMSVCADGDSATTRTKKVFWVYETGKQKYLGSHCVSLGMNLAAKEI